MYNSFAKVMLFLSEYSHVLLVLGAREWSSGHHAVSILLFVLSLSSAFVALNADSVFKEKKISVGTQSILLVASSVKKNNFMGYVFAFMLALFIAALVIKLTLIPLAIFSVIALGLFVYQMKNEINLFPYNPFLYFKGYRLYNVEKQVDGELIPHLLLSKVKHDSAVTMMSEFVTVNAVGKIENSVIVEA